VSCREVFIKTSDSVYHFERVERGNFRRILKVLLKEFKFLSVVAALLVATDFIFHSEEGIIKLAGNTIEWRKVKC